MWAELSEDVGLRPAILTELEHGQQFKAENAHWGTSCFALAVTFVFDV